MMCTYAASKQVGHGPLVVETREDNTFSLTHMHLLDVRSPALVGWYHGNLSDLDGARSRLVTPCHIAICKIKDTPLNAG